MKEVTNENIKDELTADEEEIDKPNRETWWGRDATRILDYIEMYRGNMSDFEVLEDIMCGSYVDEPDLYEDEPTSEKLGEDE